MINMIYRMKVAVCFLSVLMVCLWSLSVEGSPNDASSEELSSVENEYGCVNYILGLMETPISVESIKSVKLALAVNGFTSPQGRMSEEDKGRVLERLHVLLRDIDRVVVENVIELIGLFFEEHDDIGFLRDGLVYDIINTLVWCHENACSQEEVDDKEVKVYLTMLALVIERKKVIVIEDEGNLESLVYLILHTLAKSAMNEEQINMIMISSLSFIVGSVESYSLEMRKKLFGYVWPAANVFKNNEFFFKMFSLVQILVDKVDLTGDEEFDLFWYCKFLIEESDYIEPVNAKVILSMFNTLFDKPNSRYADLFNYNEGDKSIERITRVLQFLERHLFCYSFGEEDNKFIRRCAFKAMNKIIVILSNVEILDEGVGCTLFDKVLPYIDRDFLRKLIVFSYFQVFRKPIIDDGDVKEDCRKVLQILLGEGYVESVLQAGEIGRYSPGDVVSSLYRMLEGVHWVEVDDEGVIEGVVDLLLKSMRMFFLKKEKKREKFINKIVDRVGCILLYLKFTNNLSILNKLTYKFITLLLDDMHEINEVGLGIILGLFDEGVLDINSDVIKTLLRTIIPMLSGEDERRRELGELVFQRIVSEIGIGDVGMIVRVMYELLLGSDYGALTRRGLSYIMSCIDEDLLSNDMVTYGMVLAILGSTNS